MIGVFLVNKIADAVTKWSDGKIEKQEPVEEIIIPLEKRDEILNKSEKDYNKWNTIKHLNYYKIQLYQNLWQKYGLKWMMYQVPSILLTKV